MSSVLWWVSADNQTSLRMGDYPTAADAEAAIPAAKAEMLDQCADDGQWVLDGKWSVEGSGRGTA